MISIPSHAEENIMEFIDKKYIYYFNFSSSVIIFLPIIGFTL